MLGDGNETQATDVKNNGRWNYNSIYRKTSCVSRTLVGN